MHVSWIRQDSLCILHVSMRWVMLLLLLLGVRIVELRPRTCKLEAETVHSNHAHHSVSITNSSRNTYPTQQSINPSIDRSPTALNVNIMCTTTPAPSFNFASFKNLPLECVLSTQCCHDTLPEGMRKECNTSTATSTDLEESTVTHNAQSLFGFSPIAEHQSFHEPTASSYHA